MKKCVLKIIIGALIPVTFGCASNGIIEKSEYQKSLSYLKTENIAMALTAFPRKESQHFITLLERVYLQLIDSENTSGEHTKEFHQLLAISRQIEENEKTSISNELDQLFFIKTNEGYYPGNHEIFWMHLMLGLTFIKKKEVDKARVEAKRISELFARVDIKGRPFYDNSSIRVLSAMLWVLCGEKENALVDLRRLTQWTVPPILQNETDPISWDITFRGVGYTPETDMTSFANKLSGFRAIQFQTSVLENDVPSLFSSKNWHAENLVRNEEFKDTIQKSKYMSRMFKSELEYQTLNVLTSVATGTVLVAGITLGVGIVGGGIYILASHANAGEAAVHIMGIGFLVGAEIYNQGIQFYESTQRKIQTERKDYQDVSRFYRFVRFIPDYFQINQKPDYLDKKQTPFLQSSTSAGRVRLFFRP